MNKHVDNKDSGLYTKNSDSAKWLHLQSIKDISYKIGLHRKVAQEYLRLFSYQT